MTKRIEASDAFPLAWPDGWPHTPSHKRKSARYKTTHGRAVAHLVAELRRMGATGVVISTNAPLRRDGLPYSNQGRIDEPGVAVYFTRKTDKDQQVIACDKWSRVEENVRACGLTIEALRGIERAGASELLDRAFAGFKALPAAGEGGKGVSMWWIVLGVPDPKTANLAEVKAAYQKAARDAHPDSGGSHETMVVVNEAYETAQRVVAGRL